MKKRDTYTPLYYTKERDCSAFLVILLLAFLTFGGLLTVGLVLNARIATQDSEIKTLKMDTMHLEMDLMDVMMNLNTPFSTRVLQNGTVALGFPIQPSLAPSSTADFSDYVMLEYTLEEVMLTSSGAPITLLKLSGSPRPIVFNGYTPAPTLPKNNDLRVQLALFSPGITILDSIAQNFLIFPYSSTTANKIILEPNCVLSAECAPEAAISPFFSTEFSTFNSVTLYPNGNIAVGRAVLEFIWGQKTYASIPAQYNFVGSTISFNGTIQFQLPHL